MIVCIAEKPSVARDIALIIGATTSHDGYMEGNGFQVTWTFGHLCTLKEPHDYTPMWKAWSLTSLPMIPERFGIKLIDDNGIKYTAEPSLLCKNMAAIPLCTQQRAKVRKIPDLFAGMGLLLIVFRNPLIMQFVFSFNSHEITQRPYLGSKCELVFL